MEVINENEINNEKLISYKKEKKERRKEKTLAEIENDVKKKWEEIKNCSREDVDIAEKYYNENSVILYVPTSIKCEGIDDIIRVHSYKNHCGISTKDLSSEVIINTSVCGNTITEEKILTILHSRPIQWLLPGVQATGRRIVLPIVTIVSFDDDLYIKNKRLYWDQACVLKQIGLISTISRCPYNGEDTEVPAKGVQQIDPLISREQLEDINSLDILNRCNLRRNSVERFKDLRSEYVNKNTNDSVKKLFEEKGFGVEEVVEYDGRRRSYNNIDFKNKSDTLSGFVSGGIKEEYTRNEKITNKNYKKDKNESKNINEILTESNTDISLSKYSNSISSGSKRMFKEYLFNSNNVFSPSGDSENTVYSGKRIFTDKNKDSVKISMDKSDTESECTDNYSTMYDIDSSDGKWDSKSQSRQSLSTISRDETITDISNEECQSDLICEQMKNMCLKNNYVDNINEKKHERKRKHHVPVVPPHFISNITFDNYGSQDIYEKSKYRRKRKMVPQMRSTFKIAYDKEELESDYKKSQKPVSPTYISHVFDNDATVIKQRPVHKNSVFYDSICFDNYTAKKSEYKPPLIIRDKYISNIFSESPVYEVFKCHNKRSPNIKNRIDYSNINYNGIVKEEEEIKTVRKLYKGMEDNMNKIFAEPSIDSLVHPVVSIIPKNNINYTTFNFDDPPEETSPCSPVLKDKFISHLFREESKDSVPVNVRNVNDLSTRAGIYSVLYGGEDKQSDPTLGIKTKYNKIDHLNEIFDGRNEKLSFNDIKTINSIHNSMHQSQQ